MNAWPCWLQMYCNIRYKNISKGHNLLFCNIRFMILIFKIFRTLLIEIWCKSGKKFTCESPNNAINHIINIFQWHNFLKIWRWALILEEKVDINQESRNCTSESAYKTVQIQIKIYLIFSWCSKQLYNLIYIDLE